MLMAIRELGAWLCEEFSVHKSALCRIAHCLVLLTGSSGLMLRMPCLRYWAMCVGGCCLSWSIGSDRKSCLLLHDSRARAAPSQRLPAASYVDLRS